MPDSRTAHDGLSVDSWRTIRVALSQAYGARVITRAQFEAAMTEVMGTSDQIQW